MLEEELFLRDIDINTLHNPDSQLVVSQAAIPPIEAVALLVLPRIPPEQDDGMVKMEDATERATAQLAQDIEEKLLEVFASNDPRQNYVAQAAMNTSLLAMQAWPSKLEGALAALEDEMQNQRISIATLKTYAEKEERLHLQLELALMQVNEETGDNWTLEQLAEESDLASKAITQPRSGGEDTQRG